MKRRNFLMSVLVGAVATVASSSKILAQALVDPADSLAKALGYHVDATKVDAKKWPTWKAGSLCSNCNLYQKVDAEKGKCTIFPGKLVKTAGWCSTWIAVVKKP